MAHTHRASHWKPGSDIRQNEHSRWVCVWGEVMSCYNTIIMKRQWWSTIQPISTKRAITSRLNQLHTNWTSDFGDPSPWFGTYTKMWPGKSTIVGNVFWRVSCSRPLLYISKKSRSFVTATKTKVVVHTQFSILFYWQSRFVTQAGPSLSHFYLALPDTLLSLFSFWTYLKYCSLDVK
jgi:hypothetical protein